MDIVKVKHHIASLEVKHAEIDHLIKEAHAHYDSDEKIKQLKLKKLHIKSEIEALENYIVNK